MVGLVEAVIKRLYKHCWSWAYLSVAPNGDYQRERPPGAKRSKTLAMTTV